MSLNLKAKINPWLTPYYSLSIQNMLYESFGNKKKHEKLNNLTASATLLPKQLIYYTNFDDHYVKSKISF